ncbi:hypothetical protein ACFL6I_13505 [candidate division KSB1 bacterium]
MLEPPLCRSADHVYRRRRRSGGVQKITRLVDGTGAAVVDAGAQVMVVCTQNGIRRIMSVHSFWPPQPFQFKEQSYLLRLDRDILTCSRDLSSV